MHEMHVNKNDQDCSHANLSLRSELVDIVNREPQQIFDETGTFRTQPQSLIRHVLITALNSRRKVDKHTRKLGRDLRFL